MRITHRACVYPQKHLLREWLGELSERAWHAICYFIGDYIFRNIRFRQLHDIITLQYNTLVVNELTRRAVNSGVSAAGKIYSA